MHSIKQLFTWLIIFGLIFSGFGYWALPKIINRAPVTAQSSNDNFNAGLNAAYNRLIARGRADVAVPGYGYRSSEIIGGKIKEIKAGQIVLEVYPVNALADPALDQRSVKINDSTKIYEQVEKTVEQLKLDGENFSKQMEEYSRLAKEQKLEELPNPPRPPEPFNKQAIKLSDLKAGDLIFITAQNDIHAAKEFAAEEITAQFSAPAVTPKK